MVGKWSRGLVLLTLTAGLAPLILAQEGGPCQPSQLVVGGSLESGQNSVDSRDTPRVISLNLSRQTDTTRMVQELSDLTLLQDSDLLLLQEVESVEVSRALAEALGMFFVFGERPESEGSLGKGLTILSRYRLRDPELLPLQRLSVVVNSRCRFAIGATIDTPLGSMRVYDVHLDTRINSKARTQQMQPLLQAGGSWPGPVVIAGDLNTNNFFWVAHLFPVPFVSDQAESVREEFAEYGFKTPFVDGSATHDHLGLRLDWIFLRGTTSSESGIRPVSFSDHHAVWLKLAGD